MEKLLKYHWLFVFVVLSACSYDFPEEDQPTKQDWGELNPVNIVVVGDDFLSGLMDGALYNSGQENSIAAIVNMQISTVETLPFIQANIDSENGLNLFVSEKEELYGKWMYQFQNETDEKPLRILLPGEKIQDYTGDKNLLNDLSVPMLKVAELHDATSENNQFIQRIFSENNPNLIDQIVSKSPSFVLCWLGMNDFLDFSIHGATQAEKLTSLELFTANYEDLVNGLIEDAETKIVIGNLVSFQDLPYFYLRPYNSLFLNTDKLNAAFARYSEFNKAVLLHNHTAPLEFKRPVIDFFDNGSNLSAQRFVIVDNNLSEAFYPDGSPLEKYRQLTEEELVLFSLSDEDINMGRGSVLPIEETGYLTEAQIVLIEESLDSFNQKINELASRFPAQVKVVDLYNEIRKIAETGKKDAWGDPTRDEVYYFDGVPIEGTIDLNGIFSLDGLHFNKRGNAFVANLFLQVINDELDANVPEVSINNFVGNTYSD